MQIDITFDSSVDTAPAAFKTDVNTAVQFLENEFTNPVTVTIDVGYGEIDGLPLLAGDIGESEWTVDERESYSAVRSALVAQNAPGSSTLPLTSLFSSDSTLYINPAETTALGLPLSVSDGGVDGYVGFSSEPDTFGYADGTAPPANENYFIGVVEHELTEDMGRVSLLNEPDQYSVADLFRYSSSGDRDLTTGKAGSTAYFSINNGETDLGSWNNDPNNGDLADWYGNEIPNGGDDAFDDYSPTGVVNIVSQSDITFMEALGWIGPQPSWTEIDGGTPAAMAGGDFEGLGSAQLAVSEAGSGTYIYSASSGSLTKIDGGVYSALAAGNIYGTSNGNDNNADLAASLPGSGTYIWSYSSGWIPLDQAGDHSAPTLITTGNFYGGNPLIAGTFTQYGAYNGTYIWSSSNGWSNLNGAGDTSTPTGMAAGDFKGLGYDQLAGSFPGYGLFIWTNNGGWANLNAAGDHSAPTQLAAGNFYGTSNGNNDDTDLAAYFPGYGTYIWSPDTGYTKIDSSVAAGYAAVNLAGKGPDELLAYFFGSGVYEWSYSGGWSKYDATSALPTSAQQALFATGNFQGGSVIDAAVGFTGQSGIWLDPPIGSPATSSSGESAASPVASSAPVTVANGGTVDLNTPSTAAVKFAGLGGTLQLDQSASFAGTISGFGGQDQLDLTGIAFGANCTLGYAENNNNSGGSLTVSDGVHTANIALLGSYMASSFAKSSDGHGGTLISEAAQMSGQVALLAQPHTG